MAHHDGTEVIIMYIESFREGRRFVEAARLARSRGKPVVLITVGAGEASARAARSHTGALVGDTDVIDAACRAAGAIRVLSPEQAIQVAQAMLCPGRAPGPRVGIVADGGGHGAIAAELATSYGLSIPVFSPDLTEQISGHLPETGTASNPVDLAGAEKDLNVYERVIGLMLNSGEVDAVVFSGFFGGFGRDSDEDYDLEIDVATRLAQTCLTSRTPLFVHSMNFDTEAAQKLRDRRVPVFWSADGAVRSLSMAIDWRQPILELQDMPPQAERVTGDDYWSTRQWLAGEGIPFPRAVIARSQNEALVLSSDLEYPLVIKALGLLHKSDAGGVVLSLRDEEELACAACEIFERLRPDAITVEEMAPLDLGVEVIVGVKRDPTFGPVIMIGFGGIYAEVLRDFATALAPVDAQAVRKVLRSLHLAPLLEGVRGKPAVDVEALAGIVARFSTLAAAHPEIAEMEMNPVLVTPTGAVALDCRIALNTGTQHVDIDLDHVQ
jgi:acetate---CoA ligase (ADP-forming)